jgi:hypothetical protein
LAFLTGLADVPNARRNFADGAGERKVTDFGRSTYFGRITVTYFGRITYFELFCSEVEKISLNQGVNVIHRFKE